MKRVIFMFLFALVGFFMSASVVGAKKLHDGAIPSLQSGELIRLQATVGAVKGGHSYLFTKRVRRTRRGLQVDATLKARTNSFFDKIHRINNRFHSHFVMADRMCPYSYKVEVDQAGTVMTRTIHFWPQGRHSKLRSYSRYKRLRGKKYTRKYDSKHRVPLHTHNLVSAFYKARFLPYRPGKTYSFYVFVTGRLWHVSGRLQRKVKIYTIFGAKRALLIYAKARRLRRGAKPRYIHIWLSDDAQRIPLKIQGYVKYVGAATAVLTGYRRSLRSRYIDGTRRKRRGRRRVWQFLSRF